MSESKPSKHRFVRSFLYFNFKNKAFIEELVNLFINKNLYCKMAKKHDESKVLAQLKHQWEAEIDFAHKIVRVPDDACLSIHICGKISFLENYCGWKYSTYNRIEKAKKLKEKKEKLKNKKNDKTNN